MPIVNEHINSVKQLVLASGKYCGIVTTGPEDMERRKNEGFGMLACGLDTGLLLNSIRQVLSGAGHDRKITPDLSPKVG